MAGSAASFLSPLPSPNSLRPRRFLPTFLGTLSATATNPSSSSSKFSRSSSSRPFFHAPPRFCCLAEGGDAASDSLLLTEKPWAHSGGTAKAPTAPWAKGVPLLLPAEDVLEDLSRRAPAWRKRNGKPCGRSLTDKVRGGRSRQAMKKIVQSIAQLGEKTHHLVDEDVEEEEEEVPEDVLMKYPLEQLQVRVLGSGKEGEGEMPWVGTEKPLGVFPRAKKQRAVTAAELALPEALLRRLRMEARRLTKWVKAKKAGVTDDVVDEIRATWRRDDLAMVKFVEPLCGNMDRAREIVEVI